MTWREDIKAAPTSPKVSSSTVSGDVVNQTPASLLAQARAYAPDLTLDEYALARVIASEHGSGPPTALVCIGDCDINRARKRGLSLFDHITNRSGRFGRQSGNGDKRPVSSARDPGPRHVVAALKLTRSALGAVFDPLGLAQPAARGVARGGTHYFDPKAQNALNARWESTGQRPKTTRDALEILHHWTFDFGWQWVGTIPGVYAYELMLFRSKTTAAAQQAAYVEAKKVIDSNGSYYPPPSVGFPIPFGSPVLIAALVGGAILIASQVS